MSGDVSYAPKQRWVHSITDSSSRASLQSWDVLWALQGAHRWRGLLRHLRQAAPVVGMSTRAAVTCSCKGRSGSMMISFAQGGRRARNLAIHTPHNMV